ncbi:glucosamine-6-phosphate deaminase [Salipaludibacillus sp. CUR1]|uniref:glucosamine-6-phosphate deaminase n=1 Tax=Salipaludibacillus sp. CUR1 TaxID=2820003 RepID=UPI001E487548|nr:glucosamine-6-phosphate deaminase [Salipaludibacillus sp. CUR1]MCE7794100.1 glucosamine-6-phosphate deaminase [Salipaludibacillus sp. CUR1]
MKVIKAENYNDMSEKAARFIFERLVRGEVKVLGLATGGTPVGLYKRLIKHINDKNLSLSALHTVNLDEYVGLSDEDPNSYHQYMEDELFKHIQIPRSQTHLPHGDAEDSEAECTRYEKLIKDLGGVDLQLLGIGQNGHIGFNEPGSSFSGRTAVVDLAPSTIEANARYFTDKNKVPRKAITMGIGTIIESRSILLLASGKDKAEAVKKMIEGEVTEQTPATILQNHQDLTVIADKEALSQITRDI